MTSSFFASLRWRTWGLWLLPLLLLVLASVRPLAIPDEGRYAEVGRWMLITGDWLTPRVDGIPFFHKPPLLYWFEAASMAVFGATPWAARVVVALHACVMLGLMVACVRHFAGSDTARRAGWVLGTSMTFLVAGQYVNTDMMVATWMGVAIWCFARAFMHEAGVHDPWARAGFVACALGVLSKGLIGLLLPGLVLFLWIAYTWQWRKILALPWVSGLLLFAVVTLPWFVLAAREHPDMLAYMFGKHQFGRYTATTFNNARPWWFYGVAVTVLLFPWIFFVAADGVQRLRQRLTQQTSNDNAAWVALCWIWVLAILGFFSIPNSKLIGYALPVMPPLAVLASLWWQRHLASRTWGAGLFGLLSVVGVTVAVFANHYAGVFTLERSTRDVAQALVCRAAPEDVVAVVDDFPYDVMFYAQRQRPMEVIQDWAREQQEAGDDWRRELMDGVDFDKPAGAVLQPMSRLAELRTNDHAWVLAPRWQKAFRTETYAGFVEAYKDDSWILYRGVSANAGAASAAHDSASAAKSPEAAEQKRLRGCEDQRKK
jgi:4-amino-4-deoxy-L-arabinose transferase-like glycosyltransferase